MVEKKIIKATMWYTISSFFMKGIGFLSTPIYSRVLTQDEFGMVNNFYAWLSILLIVCSLSLSSSLVSARFEFKNEFESYILSNLFFGTIITAIFGAFILGKLSFFSQLFVLDAKYIVVMLLTVAVAPAYDMFVLSEQFQYKYIVVTIVSIINTLGEVAVSLLLISIMKDNMWARILGSQAVNILVGLVLYCYFLLKGKRIKINHFMYAFPIAFPYIFHLLSGTVLNSSDKTVITKMCSPQDNALYSMGYNVGLVINVLWLAMNSAFSPWETEQLQKEQYDNIKKVSYEYIASFLLITIGIMLVVPELILLLGGIEYREAVSVVPSIMIGYCFLFLYSLYANIEQYYKKTFGMSLATIICATANVIMNLYFVPIYGYKAAAYTTLVGYGMLFCFHYFLVRKMKKHICFDNKFILGSIIVVCIISYFISLLYEVVICRYMIAFVYWGMICVVGVRKIIDYGVIQRKK